MKLFKRVVEGIFISDTTCTVSYLSPLLNCSPSCYGKKAGLVELQVEHLLSPVPAKNPFLVMYQNSPSPVGHYRRLIGAGENETILRHVLVYSLDQRHWAWVA